ncbi:MAG: KamA family radical SAM protein [Planctomycetota bacterium]
MSTTTATPETQAQEEPLEPPEPTGDAGSAVAVLEEETSPSAKATARAGAVIAPKAFGVSLTQWNDWRWQMRNRIASVDQLRKLIPSIADVTNVGRVALTFPMAVTPYYASLIRRPDWSDPVFAQCVPSADELFESPALMDDPLEENADMPVPGLVHRYPDRALFIVTTTCASYCRHCTRKRVAGSRECTVGKRRLEQAAAYIEAHAEIADIVISGGDPFTMATDALEEILARLRRIPTVQVIRIGTRTPVVLPQRITEDLVHMLRKYHPVWVNTHFNHPHELTPESVQACARLADAGIPLGNQSVLLRGINDDPEVFAKLCRGLVRTRVRPYYLFQCDLVRGVEHFRTRLSKGIEIMEHLRGRLSGIAIPMFVVDAPHGGGKIPVLPTYVVSMSPTHVVLRNYEGMLVNYPEPYAAVADRAETDSAPGVWELAAGKASSIVPARTLRHRRRMTGRPPMSFGACDVQG